MTKLTYSHPTDGSIFEVNRDPALCGTWLQGYIDTNYTELVSVFGHPMYQSTSGKSKAEWYMFINGVPVTIYDYKEYDKSLDSITEWHVGGTSNKAVQLALWTLEAARHKKRESV